MDTNYPDLRHNVNNFKSDTKMAMKFQILLWNFKAFKKVDTVKVY